MATAETVQGVCFEAEEQHPILAVNMDSYKDGDRPSLINFCEKGGANYGGQTKSYQLLGTYWIVPLCFLASTQAFNFFVCSIVENSFHFRCCNVRDVVLIQQFCTDLEMSIDTATGQTVVIQDDK